MTWTCPRCGTELPDRGDLRALNPREREVLQLLVDGLGPHKIAAELGISHNTVRTHTYHIQRSLELHSNVEVISYAVRHGMTPSEVAS